MKIAIYPGSFDPITSGHLNIIRRAANIFDKLIVCVMVNGAKSPMFTQEERAKVADYAKEELVDVPYSFFPGIFTKKFPKKLKNTQCSHIVWYAYKKFGIDLDSDGRGLVTPQDLANSKHVELVQVYGFNPKKLWK